MFDVVLYVAGTAKECLGELVGQAVAAQLSISSGTLDSQGLQELGILNQVRPSRASGQVR